MLRFSVLLFLFLVGCASVRPSRQPDGSTSVVLCVENRGLNPATARAASIRMVVLPGETNCRKMFHTGNPIALRATAKSGVVRVSFSETLRPTLAQCWSWILGSSDASKLDFMPCHELPAGTEVAPSSRSVTSTL